MISANDRERSHIVGVTFPTMCGRGVKERENLALALSFALFLTGARKAR